MKSLFSFLPLLFVLQSFSQTTSTPPERTSNNVIVASYNIKWLGQMNHDLEKLAQVIQHFDVCGIVEIKNEKSLKELTEILESQTNKDWGYVYGFRTNRPNGSYHEAYGTIYRRDRIELGDGLISNVWDQKESFRNDPYFVSFKSGNFDFTIFLIHTRWTDDEDGSRSNEVNELKDQLAYYYEVTNERDVLVMGNLFLLRETFYQAE